MAGSLRALIPVEDLRAGVDFLRQLPSFLRHPVSREAARATLQHRLARRAAHFLALLKRGVYEQAENPYRHLLRLALPCTLK